MPVIYACDADGCTTRELAQVLVNNRNERVLMPPSYWRVQDFPALPAPVIICPECGKKIDAQRAANDPPAALPRVKLGVIDGGKKDDDT